MFNPNHKESPEVRKPSGLNVGNLLRASQHMNDTPYQEKIKETQDLIDTADQ